MFAFAGLEHRSGERHDAACGAPRTRPGTQLSEFILDPVIIVVEPRSQCCEIGIFGRDEFVETLNILVDDTFSNIIKPWLVLCANQCNEFAFLVLRHHSTSDDIG